MEVVAPKAAKVAKASSAPSKAAASTRRKASSERVDTMLEDCLCESQAVYSHGLVSSTVCMSEGV